MQLVISTILPFVLCLTFMGVNPAFAQESNFTLRLLHTNDHHAHLQPVEFGNHELGGITRRKTLVEKARIDSKVNNEPLLLLDAGDIFQGTLYFNQYLGQADLAFYNALGYDVATIGNHEFDRGQQILANFIANAKFPIISANIQTDKISPLAGKIKPWIILHIQGEKVGIFGLTTEETSILSDPGAGITFTDPITAAHESVVSLTKQGVNKIIALTHLGIESDQVLAHQVNGIDIIVGGHSHTPVGNIPGAVISYPLLKRSPTDHNVLIVTDWEWGKYLGDIRVVFDANGNVISWEGLQHAVDESIKSDIEFQDKLRKFDSPIEKLRQKVIGKTNVILDGNYAKVRTEETNLGDLIADAMLDKIRPDDAQIAIFNSGNIRNSISEGDVTVAEVLEVLPFGNKITRIDVTGIQLKTALENGVSHVKEVAGRFPQVAGLRFFWNSFAPIGSRISSIQVRNQKGDYELINPNATYRVVTNDFLLNGNDGYNIFKDAKNQINTGFLLSDVVIDYITTHSPINSQTESRIVRNTDFAISKKSEKVR
jgi:5'-nucleotidase/UDP-sugar diphosphatase